jgi:hypothetical protein
LWQKQLRLGLRCSFFFTAASMPYHISFSSEN